MIIYPAIDIKDGKCVRLKQGSFSEVTVYGDDPLAVAGEWTAAGASFIHIVDLDGAREGESRSEHIIKDICAAYKTPVQTGGGIRTMADIERKLNLGVARVVLGTAAVKKPELVQEAVKLFGDNIAVGIDAKNGMAAISGWEEVSEISALDLCAKMEGYGVRTVIYTDISKDGMMVGPNIELTNDIISSTDMEIIASGGVSSIGDLERLAAINASGVIIGKALYQKKLDLKSVIDRFEKKL